MMNKIQTVYGDKKYRWILIHSTMILGLLQ